METKAKLMGFRGFEHPRTQEEVIPCIRSLLNSVLEKLPTYPEQISRDETIGFLTMLKECLEPAGPGFFYCPYVPPEVNPVIDLKDIDPKRGILTRYGKKLLREQAEYKKTLIKETFDASGCPGGPDEGVREAGGTPPDAEGTNPRPD